MTLFDGEERRAAPLIVADVLTVLASLGAAVALDCTGRAAGLAGAVGLATLGLALFAGARNVATLSAGQVFYGVGFTGVRLTLDVLVTDATPTRDRALGYAAVALPWAVTAFAVPTLRYNLREAELRHALVAFACIVPALGAALVCLLAYHRASLVRPRTFRDLKAELWDPKRHLFGIPLAYISILAALLLLFVMLWLVQMDVLPWYAAIPPVVVFLFVTIAVQFPSIYLFDLLTKGWEAWIPGRSLWRRFLLWASFRWRTRRMRWEPSSLRRLDWEKLCSICRRAWEICRGQGQELRARVSRPFLWRRLLERCRKSQHAARLWVTRRTQMTRLAWQGGQQGRPLDRLGTTTMVCVCALCVIWKCKCIHRTPKSGTADDAVAHSCWSTNLHPYLQVVFLLSSSAARHVISMSTAVETVCMLPMGYFVRRKGVFRPVLLVAVPLYCLGQITFILGARFGRVFGVVVFSQVLTAVSRSTFEAVKEVALLSGAMRQQDAAILLALLSVCEKVGGMVGATLSDILWAKALPNPPSRYLNSQTILSAERIHPLLKEHLAYPVNSSERKTILRTYEATQRSSLIIGSCAMLFALVCVLKMANVNVLKKETVTDDRRARVEKVVTDAQAAICRREADHKAEEEYLAFLKNHHHVQEYLEAVRDKGRCGELQALRKGRHVREYLRALEAYEYRILHQEIMTALDSNRLFEFLSDRFPELAAPRSETAASPPSHNSETEGAAK